MTGGGSTALCEAPIDAFGHMTVFQYQKALEDIVAVDRVMPRGAEAYEVALTIAQEALTK